MDSGEAGGVEEARAHAAVLGGRTGSGKTEILHRLRDAGHAVLDLEALACHRGSAFGAIGQEPQPTNEQYENRCALAWWTQSARALHAKGTPSSIVPTSLHKGRVWMEHEGAHVGKCKVPLGLLALLNAPAAATRHHWLRWSWAPPRWPLWAQDPAVARGGRRAQSPCPLRARLR